MEKQKLISDLYTNFSEEELVDFSYFTPYLLVEIEIRFGNLSRCARRKLIEDILIEAAEDKLAAQIFVATKLESLLIQIERYQKLKFNHRILHF